FGSFGFNGASTLAATDTRCEIIIADATIAAAFGTVVSMLEVMKRFGKPDPRDVTAVLVVSPPQMRPAG
ncbi:MAG TPA: hypothetical protein VIK54_16255, partial [Acidimicrobiia bacterium]